MVRPLEPVRSVVAGYHPRPRRRGRVQRTFEQMLQGVHPLGTGSGVRALAEEALFRGRGSPAGRPSTSTRSPSCGAWRTARRCSATYSTWTPPTACRCGPGTAPPASPRSRDARLRLEQAVGELRAEQGRGSGRRSNTSPAPAASTANSATRTTTPTPTSSTTSSAGCPARWRRIALARGRCGSGSRPCSPTLSSAPRWRTPTRTP